MEPLQLTYVVSADRSTVQVTRTPALYSNRAYDSLTSGKQQVELQHGVLFQARVVVQPKDVTEVQYKWVYVTFNKRNPEDDTCKLKLTCPELNIENQICFINKNINDTWQLVGNKNFGILNFKFHFTFEKTSVSWCSPLYEDSELTDFEMVGSDGGVHFHRAVLAAASPVLRRMLSADWKEVREGQLHRPDISRATLQAFKQYLYLRRLPHTSLDQLMMLAAYYNIPEMEEACVNAINMDGSAKYQLETLETIEKRAKKLIGNDSLSKARLQSLEHRRKVTSPSVFNRLHFGECALDWIHGLIPPAPFYHRSSRETPNRHRHTVEVPKSRKKRFASTFIVRTAKLWNSLPDSLFPDKYNLAVFKTRVDRFLLGGCAPS